MALATLNPIPVYQDADGDPLEDGYLYFGTANQNPVTSPLQVYWDAAATIPVAQPVRTQNGFAMRAGSPAVIYSPSDYSLLVQDKRGVQVFYAANSANFGNDASVLAQLVAFVASLASAVGSSLVGFLQAGAGAILRTVQSKLRDQVSVLDFMSDAQRADVLASTFLIDVTAAINAAMNSGAKRIFFPEGGYSTSSPMLPKTQMTIVGANRNTTVIKALGGFAGTAMMDFPSGSYSGVTVEGLTLNANNIAARCFSMVSVTQGASDALTLRNVSFALPTARPYYIELVTGVRLEGIFSNGGTDGAYLKTCFDVLGLGITPYNGQRAALIVEGCADSNFYGVSTFNNPGFNSTSLIEINGGHHVNIDGYKTEAQGAANVTQEILIVNTLGAGNAVGHSLRNGRHRSLANTKTRSIVVGQGGATIYGTEFMNLTGIKPTGANSINLVQQQETWFKWCRDQVAYDTPNFSNVTIDNSSGFFYNSDALQTFALTINAGGTQPATLTPVGGLNHPGIKNHCEFRLKANFGAVSWTGAPTGAVQINLPFSVNGACDVQGTFFPTGVVGDINGTVLTFYAAGSATALTWAGATSGGSLVIDIRGQVAA